MKNATGYVIDGISRAAGCPEAMGYIRPLTPAEAGLLSRPEGAWFLHTTRTSWTADERFAEYADELLDPEHYELSLTYGT